MSKKDQFVEVKFRVPKRWLQFLEEQKYFDWTEEAFFQNSIRALLSCLLHEMSPSRVDKLKAKYGNDIDYYELPDC